MWRLLYATQILLALQENWALPTAKILCHLPKVGQSAKIFFADRFKKQSAKDSLPTAKQSWQVAKKGSRQRRPLPTAWQVAKKGSRQRWLPGRWQRKAGGKGGGQLTASIFVPFATCQAVRQSIKTKFFIFEI